MKLEQRNNEEILLNEFQFEYNVHRDRVDSKLAENFSPICVLTEVMSDDIKCLSD